MENIFEFLEKEAKNPQGWSCEGKPENYQVNNYQLTYSPENHGVMIEEVCQN